MRTPSHFDRLVTQLGDEAVHGPGIQESIVRVQLSIVLRIALGDLHRAHAQVQRQLCVISAKGDALDDGKLLETLFHEMRDQAGVCTVCHQGRRAALAT